MELLQLRYFFESSKSDSFAKTAEKYMVPASSVSASVKRLEKELGCRLFDRHANCILLNDNGRKLQRSLCVIFDELEQTAAALAPAVDEDTEVKILVRSLRAKITDQIIRFHQQYPTIRFYTSCEFGDSAPDGYDIIIDEDDDRYAEYERFELCSYRIGIKTAATSPLCERRLRLSQLRNQPFVSMGESSNLHRILLNACRKAGFDPHIIMQTNDTGCYRKCIEAGLGLAVSREYTNTGEDSGKVRFLDITDFNERQTVYVYYKKTHANAKRFMHFLKAEA